MKNAPSNHVRTMLGTAQQGEAVQIDLHAAEMLTELISGMGHDPSTIRVDDLQGIADRLSTLAGHTPAWGWRYLRNVLSHKINASRALVDAIMRLGALVDGAPADLARAQRVTVNALGNVKPGALILADSIPCICGVEFVPRTWNQRHHTRECGKLERKNRRKNERQI